MFIAFGARAVLQERQYRRGDIAAAGDIAATLRQQHFYRRRYCRRGNIVGNTCVHVLLGLPKAGRGLPSPSLSWWWVVVMCSHQMHTRVSARVEGPLGRRPPSMAQAMAFGGTSACSTRRQTANWPTGWRRRRGGGPTRTSRRRREATEAITRRRRPSSLLRAAVCRGRNEELQARGYIDNSNVMVSNGNAGLRGRSEHA